MRQASVLVVEPEPRTALRLRRQLTALGYSVCGCAGDLVLAIDRARELHPDAVLLDLGLAQDTTGSEATRNLRACSEAALILLSSQRRSPSIQPARADLADGYLVVPCKAADLDNALKIALACRAERAAVDPGIERLRRLADRIPMLLAYLGADGRYQFANRLHEKWFGIARDRIPGRALLEVLGPQWQEALRQPLAQALAGQAVAFDYESIEPEGRHVQVSLVPDRDADGVQGVFLAAANITGRVEAERLLRKDRDAIHSILDAMGEAVLAVDACRSIQYMNPAAEALTQWDAVDACGLPIDQVLRFVDPDTGRRIDSPVQECLEAGCGVHLPVGALLLSREGREHSVEDSCAPIRDGEGTTVGAVLLLRAARPHRMSLAPGAHDALTGLMNRREFERAIEWHARAAREGHGHHALLHIDIDHLQRINETCGHHAGDALLRRLAAIMQATLRRSDLVARLGGDEFGVFMTGCPLHRAEQTAHTLVDAVRHAGFSWQGHSYNTTVSIGAAATAQLGPAASTLLAAAEAACALASDAGGDRVHAYLEQDGTAPAALKEDGDWSARIGAALAGDRFHLFAQRVAPIDDPEAVAHCAHEILLRLVGHGGGLLPPMAFLPAAERCRLMSQVDRWVIGHSLRALAPYLRGWSSGTGQPCYSINLSAASLSDEGLLDFVAAQLEQSAVAPQLICFEISEAVALSRLRQASALAKGLRALGCRFALDHFHSGVSAHAYLQELPVDYVKIDGSFVKGMLSDRLDCAVVEGISRVGQALGIQTVAEYADSDAILARLKDLGVGHAQGYAIHRPEPLLCALEGQSELLAGRHAPGGSAVPWAVDWYQH